MLCAAQLANTPSSPANARNGTRRAGGSCRAEATALLRADVAERAQRSLRFGTRLAFFNKVRRELDPHDRLVNQFFQSYLPQA